MAKKLLDQMRNTLRRKHYSYRTGKAYMDRVKRYTMRTTMIYAHVLQRGGLAVRSPLG